ncbi:hypothetical protein AcV5_001092 [Taiwanofungus camphoratus]|nr:hypothetical protein AcV7_003493 [Antrodia cinnamomea]KAI0939800.1 hypothetical protein AcV5_001092 [Antrodia cinnamomea]
MRPAQPETFSPEELYNVLCGAASQDPAQVQESAKRLKEILDLPGAFDTLYEIAAQRTVPLPVRQQSIIQFKNSALGHWRSRKLLSDEQRVRIRARCLTLLDESDDIISECNEVIVGRISRQDFPQNWPSLVSQLMSIINSGVESHCTGTTSVSSLPLRRGLETLNAILKEFTSVKMPSGIKIMGQLAEDLHQTLQNHYSRVTASFSTTLNPSSIALPRTAEELLLAQLLFKCLVKVAVWSWHRMGVHRDYHKFEPWLRELFKSSAMQLQMLSELRINLLLALQPLPKEAVLQRSVDILTRHVYLFGKLFRRMQQLSVSQFVALPMCSDLVMYYWSKVVQASDAPSEYIADTPVAILPVRFLVQAMTLFKDSLAQWAPVRKDGSENATVLPKEFVEGAVRLLVTRFIPLNPADLEEWMADPEGWVNVEEQDNEQWVFEIRPCAERVLMSLANQYRQYVTPLLATTFGQVAGQRSVDLASVVQKEALYCAIGRCASRLKESIPFDEWLEHTLVAEAQDTNPNYPILKRRIAWVIGKWVSDMCSPANNPKIWQILVYLLQDRGSGTDEVVRLTAAIALRECVDTVDFDVDTFAPFLPTAVNQLVRLTAEADTLESKRRIASSLNAVIERAGPLIVPLMENVAEPIPQLWTSAGEDWLFKASLLGTVTKLIESAGEHSSPLSVLVVPLVRDSFSPRAQVQLDEDALILWQAALRNFVTLKIVDSRPELFDLFPLAISLLSENLDLLGRIVGIIESYFLLNAVQVLQSYALDLFRALSKAMSQALSVNVTNMATALNLLFQLSPSSLWGETLHLSGLFAMVVKTLVDDKSSTSVLTEYIYLLARMALADKYMFLQLISATAASQNTTESVLYMGVLDQWWTRFDNMSEPRHRKLTAMGIANLVSTGRHEVLERLHSEIFNLWVDVFGEIREAQTDGSSLALYWDQPTNSFYSGSEGTPEYDRRKALYDNDPVRTTQLTTFVAARLQEAEMACGGAVNLQTKYLAKADPLVLKQIQAELAGKQS